MSEAPRRWLDSGDELSSLLRGALEAERSDDVDRARLARIGRGVASAIADGAAAAPAHAALTPPAAPAKATWLASKGPFVLVAAASLSGIAAIALREAPAAKPIAASRVEVPVAAAEPARSSAAPEPPTMSPADLPSVPVTTPAAPSMKPAVKSAPSSASSDIDEIALLARAHDVLHAEPTRSIVLCNEHERRWPGGHFAQEREALAIEALVYLGRRDEAERRWATFRERFPSSSHRVHLESLFAAPASQ